MQEALFSMKTSALDFKAAFSMHS